jgi:hypothetical protein
MKIMGLIDKQHDRLFALANQIAQRPFAIFALGGDLGLFLGKEIIEERGDQRRQAGAFLVDGKRFGDGDALLRNEDVL